MHVLCTLPATQRVPFNCPVPSACTHHLFLTSNGGFSDVTASPWQCWMAPPRVDAGTQCERTQELASPQPERLHLCARVVNDGMEKNTWGRKQAAVCHILGDTWPGRGPLDSAPLPATEGHSVLHEVGGEPQLQMQLRKTCIS